MFSLFVEPNMYLHFKTRSTVSFTLVTARASKALEAYSHTINYSYIDGTYDDDGDAVT